MSKGEENETAPGAPFPLRGYLILNAIVWLFSLAMIGAGKAFVRDTLGIAFLFAALSACFAAMSIFDALYDRARPSAGSKPAKRRL